MRTLVTKQPTHESPKQNQSREKGRSISPLSTGMPLLQRQCACGGGCPRCQDELGIQTKLKIREPGDKYEQEADRSSQHITHNSPSNIVVSQTASPLIQRQRRRGGSRTPRAAATPRVGTRFTHPSGSRSPYTSLTAEFDGRDFILKDGSTVLMQVVAHSGRPVSVRPTDARDCGGSISDSYVNNPLYVGISNYGPIPEGRYYFRATEFAMFSAAEQAQFTLGGHFRDPFGAVMHGGDWGAGRASLHPRRVVSSPHCGNTRRRSGFYIHGGSLAGSSGCIDIGNSGITSLLSFLPGYRERILLSVQYRHPAPAIGLGSRILGGATYPGQQDPTLLDRLGGAFRELGRGLEGE